MYYLHIQESEVRASPKATSQVKKPLADWPCLMALVDVTRKKG